MYALIALGYTMVYGVLEFINFAHSEIFIVGAFVGVEILLVAASRPAGSSASRGSLVLLLVILAGHGWPAACWRSPSSAWPTGPCGRRPG